MYKTILVAVDDSELSHKAVQHAVGLAGLSGATLIAVTVTEARHFIAPGAEMAQIPTATILGEVAKADAERAAGILRQARETAGGTPLEALHVRNSHPADGILKVADERGADLIVMGSHGRRGLGRLLLGSQSTEVLSRSKVPVLIVR